MFEDTDVRIKYKIINKSKGLVVLISFHNITDVDEVHSEKQYVIADENKCSVAQILVKPKRNANCNRTPGQCNRV
jgi:hypothetical protein